jgi:uncharacterized protein YpuA (DUF1002 family)
MMDKTSNLELNLELEIMEDNAKLAMEEVEETEEVEEAKEATRDNHPDEMNNMRENNAQTGTEEEEQDVVSISTNMDKVYGPQTGRYDLRARKPRDYHDATQRQQGTQEIW